MNWPDGIKEWRERHHWAWTGLWVLFGVNIGWLLTLLPVWFFLPLVLIVTTGSVVMTVRETRRHRRFAAAMLRLRIGLANEDEAAIQAAALDLALLLPSAKKGDRSTSSPQ